MTGEALGRALEMASLRAWPAIEEVDLDGWMLRFSEGFTGRANSVQALRTADQPLKRGTLEARVACCERWYGERGRPSLFRITPYSETGLEETLADLGYERFNRTLVLHREPAGLVSRADGLELHETPLHEWLGRYARFTGIPATPAPMRRIIEKSAGRAFSGLVWTSRPRRAVACGLAVLEGDFMGLFDLVVDPAERGKGYGEELVRRLATWGAANGADRVYLQVTVDNRPARGLYEKLGFEPAYEYWYRTRRA